MGSYNKNSSVSALPRIKVKSPLSGLPPQCPGRIRCHLEVTVGPVEWNPLHSINQSDDKMSLSLIWWGDESSTDLPISTTRETFTYFKPEWRNAYSNDLSSKYIFHQRQSYLWSQGQIQVLLRRPRLPFQSFEPTSGH